MKKMTTTRFIAFWLCLCPLFCMAQGRYTDSLALVALYNATNGLNWVPNTWDLTQPMDDWHGVTLNENGRVTRLHIPENNLSGNIPPEIGDLSELKELYLFRNNLSGSLPDEIGNLTNIELFNVKRNSLSGTVPVSFGNLTKLKDLTFSSNQLEGNVFDIIINLPELESLHVSGNYFTGSIPQSISSLTQLKEMSLYNNLFSGELPSELADLQQLTRITLGLNQFEGCYPDSISHFCSFPEWPGNTHMSDGTNFIAEWEDFCNTGAGACSTYIPCRESDSLALVALYEATNGASWTNTWDLSLPIRDWYGVHLDADGCVTCIDMDGGSNDCWADYASDGNNLQGTIPYQIGDLGSLKKLYLTNNQITGSIPSEIGNLDKLEELLLLHNQIFGNIPIEIGNLTELLVVDLSDNQLSETIPTEIENLTNLKAFNLWGNELEGNIPPEIGNLTNLTQLKLFHNQFSGNLPPEMANLTNLHLVYLHNNHLTGSIVLFDTLNYLTDLRLSNNQFSDSIPDFSILPNLTTLHLHGNKFLQEDIAANFDSNNTLDFTYTPQYYGDEQFHTNAIGASVVLSPNPAIPYENPSVIWLQNDSHITSEDTLHDTTYNIASLDTPDIGVYQYRFIDTTLTPLVEFHSLPINNYVQGLDLSGNPVIPGQLIVEYKNNASQQDIDSIRNRLIDKYNGSLIDSCGCSVALDLWTFDIHNIDAVKQILGLHSRTRHDDESTDIDGGHDVELNINTQQGNQSLDECGIYVPDYENGEQILIQAYDTIPAGTDTVVIAVTDSGMSVDAKHIWINEAEQNGIPDIDDDNNGYIDDTLNINFTNDTINGSHGKAVIGRIVNNIPENMNIKVMSIKTFDGQGIGTLFDLLCGIYYAIDNGADIVNISAGYAGDESAVFKNALQFGRDKDVLFVVSAGNDTLNLNTTNYWPPAFARDGALVHTMIVTAEVDDDYQIMDYSNIGDSTLTVAAPGKIYTDDYGCVTGTSFSAPLVALAAAMEKTFDANKNHIIVRNNFIERMDISPGLDTLVKDGRVLRVSIKSGECEQVQNGDFSNEHTNWNHWGCNITNVDNGLAIDIQQPTEKPWEVALTQQGSRYEYGKQYHVSFKAKADANRSIIVKPGHKGPPYTSYGSRRIYLTTTLQTHEFVFTMNHPTDPNGYLEFHLGESDINLFITDISVNKLSCAEDFPINCEQIKNGDFSNEQTNWHLRGSTGTNIDNGLAIDIPSLGQNSWDVALTQEGFFFEQGKQYHISFKAKADANRIMRVKPGLRGAPYTPYGWGSFYLTTTLETHEFVFTMNHPTDLNGFLEFVFGESDINLFIANISLKEISCIIPPDCQQVQNSDFSNGTTGWNSWSCDINISEEQCHISNIQEVSNPWNAVVAYSGLAIEYGKQYEVRFDAASIQNSRTIRVKVGLGVAPYDNYNYEEVLLSTDNQHFNTPFAMSDTSTTLGRLEFHVGTDDTALILDNVELVSLSGDCGGYNDCEQVQNGGFSNGTIGWNRWNCDINISEEQCHISNIQEVSNPWNAAVAYGGLTIEYGKQYEVRFDAASVQNSRIIKVKVGLGVAPYDTYKYEEIVLNTNNEYFNIPFTMSDTSTTLGRLEFQVGTDDTALILDNVELVSLSGDCVEIRESLSNELISNYLVFPNPTSGTLNVLFDLPHNYDSGTIRLFDINGRLLLKHREAMFTRNQFQLDLNNIPAGVYLLRINVGEYMLTHKVIKSHR